MRTSVSISKLVLELPVCTSSIRTAKLAKGQYLYSETLMYIFISTKC